MSKGLGQLQLAILAHLDNRDAWDRLPKGVYDLRRIARYVYFRDSDTSNPESLVHLFAHPYNPDPAFSVGFSRAVRSLIRRGMLEPVRGVDCGRPTCRQVRFVRVP